MRADDQRRQHLYGEQRRDHFSLGAIADKGTIPVNGGDGEQRDLNLNAAVTLSGGGMVTMTSATGGGGAYVEAWRHPDQHRQQIEGRGIIGDGSLTIVNGGTMTPTTRPAGALNLNGNGRGHQHNAPPYSKRRTAHAPTSFAHHHQHWRRHHRKDGL